MFRRSLLGLALAALGGLAFGRKGFAAPAPRLEIPSETEQSMLKDLNDPEHRTAVCRVTRKNGRDVWTRVYV